MTAWSRNRYTKSSLLAHARRAAGATGWRARMTALRAMETALGAGEGRWLSSGGSDPGLERILARARGVLDEKTVERGRAAASRAEQAARVEIEGLRLGGAYRLVDLAGDEGPALAAAARRLLRALEAFASEDLLASDRARSRSVAATGFTARSLLASLKRLDRRLAATGVDRGLREWLRVEIETAAFDEAADRIEAATLGSFVAEERAAIREIERLARAKGSYRAAIRIGSVRARLEEATSRAALRAIEEEDPLAVEFDAGTDRHAVLDRVVAGIERLDTLHREEVEFGGFEWEELGRTLRGYRTGDRSSALTRMAERAGDYARRGTSGCGEPLQGDPGPPPGRLPGARPGGLRAPAGRGVPGGRSEVGGGRGKPSPKLLSGAPRLAVAVLGRARGAGRAAFDPGRAAAKNRGPQGRRAVSGPQAHHRAVAPKPGGRTGARACRRVADRARAGAQLGASRLVSPRRDEGAGGRAPRMALRGSTAARACGLRRTPRSDSRAAPPRRPSPSGREAGSGAWRPAPPRPPS